MSQRSPRNRVSNPKNASKSTAKKRRPARVPGQVDAEWAYAQSIAFQQFGPMKDCVESLRRAHKLAPTWAPAVFTLGTVEYQPNHPKKGRDLFRSLVDLPDAVGDLHELLDKAGTFLIDLERYDEALDLNRRAVHRYPRRAPLYLGIS